MSKSTESSSLWNPAPARPRQPDWGDDDLDAVDAAVASVPPAKPNGHWDLQISSFKARHGLAGTAGQNVDLSAAAFTQPQPTLADLQECVGMLESMHAELGAAHAQRQRLEQQLFEARATLAMTKNQMASMQNSERRARYQARHDGLTMLPNRSFFDERFAEALMRAAREKLVLAVLYIDLDGFKQINDLYGHGTGDELLRVVGARLARAVRSTDVVGRLGGDEFGCLLMDLPPDRKPLDRIVAKLQDAISTPFRIGNRSLAVRPSIGIAMYPDDGRTAAVLLRRADAAMYSAKAARSGHEFFDATIHG